MKGKLKNEIRFISFNRIIGRCSTCFNHCISLQAERRISIKPENQKYKEEDHQEEH